MEGQGRSEGKVLEELLKHARSELAKRDDLVRRIEELGGKVDAAEENGSPWTPDIK